MTRCIRPLSLVLALALAGCYVPSPKLGKTETLQQKIGLADAKAVSASISLGVGRLRLSGGADSLMDARFEYNIPDWKPAVTYSVTDSLGRLVIEQPSRVVGATWPGNVRYDWDVKLNPNVPLELEIDMGVGKSDVDLRGLDVRRFRLEAGVGEGSVDLSGPRTSDLDATIKAGVGRLTLILPTDVGVRVKAEGGLGHVSAQGLKSQDDAWVNDAWDKTKPSLRVEVEGGIGEVDMHLVGSTGNGSI
jgi:hypothetical protein